MDVPAAIATSGSADGSLFNDKMEALEAILEKGVQKLLAEVRSRGITKPPYGRPPPASPLISEEAFVSLGDFDSSDDASDEPVFTFSYGFNPLTFLADYVLWCHPNSQAQRLADKVKAAERLRFRAQHADKQLVVCDSLRVIARRQASGVMWGPLMCPAAGSACTSVAVTLQTLRDGWAVLQVSTGRSFAEGTVQTVRAAASAAAPTKLNVTDLLPGTLYYARCCLEDGAAAPATPADQQALTSEDSNVRAAPRFLGLDMDCFQESRFWTLPSANGAQPPSCEEKGPDMPEGSPRVAQEEDLGFAPLTLMCLSADTCRTALSFVGDIAAATRDRDRGFVVTALLGDVFPSLPSDSLESAYRTAAFVACRSPLLSSEASPCRNSSLLFAWHDCSYRSDIDARSEEITYKQFVHDTAKHTKKYGSSGSGSRRQSKVNTDKAPPSAPVLNRPPISLSLSCMAEVFPLSVAEGSIRHFYRSHMLGPDVEVFVLDLRSGYLCKDEAKWLKEGLSSSSALWKVVLAGHPIALSASPESTELRRPASRERTSIAMGDSGAVLPRGSVQLDVPEVPENRDVDALGRAKNSLPYIIFSLQRTTSRKRAEKQLDEGSNEDESTVASRGADAAGVQGEGDVLQEAEAAFHERPLFETIDSGIIFVTCNSANIGHPNKRYVATFDPVGTGHAFCAEVNVGSVSAPTANMRPMITPHLSTTFLDGQEDALVQPTDAAEGPMAHSCLLRLERSGALTVRMQAQALDGAGTRKEAAAEAGPQVVFERSFKIYQEENPATTTEGEVKV